MITLKITKFEYFNINTIEIKLYQTKVLTSSLLKIVDDDKNMMIFIINFYDGKIRQSKRN